MEKVCHLLLIFCKMPWEHYGKYQISYATKYFNKVWTVKCLETMLSLFLGTKFKFHCYMYSRVRTYLGILCMKEWIEFMKWYNHYCFLKGVGTTGKISEFQVGISNPRPSWHWLDAQTTQVVGSIPLKSSSPVAQQPSFTVVRYTLQLEISS